MRYALARDKDAGPAVEPGRQVRGKIALYEERALMKAEVAKALREAENNRSRAARLLGITRSQLYSRLQKYGLAAG